jgi:FkbM family methyltransferase
MKSLIAQLCSKIGFYEQARDLYRFADSAQKEICLSTGFYKPVRTLSRFLDRSQRTKFTQELAFYSKFLKPDSLCFDVGANVGKKAEILLKNGARVVAFEPQPDCVRELKAQCGSYGDKLCIQQSAVGAEPGELELYVRQWGTQSSFLQDWEKEIKRVIRVPVTTLDQAIAEFGIPSYCKIDVEGWELEVLKGLTQAIPLLSIEFHMRDREIDNALACLDYLATFGALQINIAPFATLSFTFPEWLSAQAFLNVFPGQFRDRWEFSYGEIFVRIP